MPAAIRLRHNRLGAIARRFPGAVSTALRRGAFATEAGMKARAPVDTGFLRNSIQTEGATPGSLSMRVIVGASYGWFQEAGARKQPGKHYTRRTTEQTFPATIRELRELEQSL